jgi:hypothetical protein
MPYYPSMPVLGNHLKISKSTCNKEARCPSTDECRKCDTHTYTLTMKYYSAIKNKIMSFAGKKCMELGIVMLSERQISLFLSYAESPQKKI